MRRPNKSGSVIKLAGKRRRPYAVRIWDGYKENASGQIIPKYKYISYHEKLTDALQQLEKYNESPVKVIKEKENSKKHKFSDIYNMWVEELERRPKPLSSQSYYSYQAAYNNLKPLHDMIFENLTLEDIENTALKNSSKSLSTITNIRIVLKGMYKTAIRHGFVSNDLSQLLILSHTDEKSRPHTPFTEDEIDILWKHKDDQIVQLVLILIYTGMRIRELLSAHSSNVFLRDRYLIGGSKTEAGKGRIIPISDKILPFMDVSNEYLITYNSKKLDYQKACNMLYDKMDALNMSHTFHDTRHTCSTLMEKANIPLLHRKLILGHATSDITDHYTHVSKEQLIEDINKL